MIILKYASNSERKFVSLHVENEQTKKINKQLK